MKNSNRIIPILFLTIVVCVSVITLALTDDATREIIEENKRAEIKRSLETQFPEMTGYEFDNEIEVYTIYKAKEMGNETVNETIGYAFEAKGAGYGGTIEMLVSLSDLSTLNGISIINHMETPGLGSRVTESSFQEQFKGIAIEDLALRKNNGQSQRQVHRISRSKQTSNAYRRALCYPH